MTGAYPDPRTPVLVAGGQTTVRDGAAPDPVQLLASVLARSVSPRLLARIDAVWMPRILSRNYPDPARLLAELLGFHPTETAVSDHGGQTPVVMVGEAARAIRAGRVGAVLIGGSECLRTRRLARRDGRILDWIRQSEDVRPARRFGPAFSGAGPAERAAGVNVPVQAYPLFETALRHRRRSDVPTHDRAISELWAKFSQVAAVVPGAALPRSIEATEIAAVTEDNRMICDPYRKLMVANDDVDQAAGFVVCSAEIALAAGIPRDNWIFVHGFGAAHELDRLSERWELSRSPAMAHAGREALRGAGISLDQVALVDLYSCFPCAVEIGVEELGLPSTAVPTVTGGLTFFGGAGNNYCSHALLAMAERLRTDPQLFGLCTGNGGFLTKQAAVVLSGKPAGGPPPYRPAAEPRRRHVEQQHRGTAVVEAYTVQYNRDGSVNHGSAVTRTASGSRCMVRFAPEAIPDPGTGELCGSLVEVGDAVALGPADSRARREFLRRNDSETAELVT